MGDPNYFFGIVKVLEIPKQKVIKNEMPIVTVKIKIPQVKNSKIILLLFWGNLAREVKKYCHVNDYVLIEGYVSIRNLDKKTILKKTKKKVVITVLRSWFLKVKLESRKTK